MKLHVLSVCGIVFSAGGDLGLVATFSLKLVQLLLVGVWELSYILFKRSSLPLDSLAYIVLCEIRKQALSFGGTHLALSLDERLILELLDADHAVVFVGDQLICSLKDDFIECLHWPNFDSFS